jgi:hypothetical protein
MYHTFLLPFRASRRKAVPSLTRPAARKISRAALTSMSCGPDSLLTSFLANSDAPCDQ